MNNTHLKYSAFVLLVLLALLSSACGTFQVDVEPAASAAPPSQTIETTRTPAVLAPLSTPTPWSQNPELLAIDPVYPRLDETISVEVQGVAPADCHPQFQGYEVLDTGYLRADLAKPAGAPCIEPASLWSVSFTLDPLPTGQWILEVYVDAGTNPVRHAAQTIYVAPPGPTPATSAARTALNSEELLLPGCYDFDAGASLAPPDPDCDLNFLPGPDMGTIEIYPVAGAQLAFGAVFPEAPGEAGCAENGAFSAEPEVVTPLAAMYVCYRTGEGRVGYLHFTDADLEQAYSVTFEWLTFAQDDGTVTPAPEPDLSYENEALGIRLTFPESWSGVEATQNGGGDVTSVCFTFVGSAPLCVLQIDAYSEAAWNNLEQIPDGYYLGENEQFVFASGPYHAECVQLDDFQCARHQEIPAILSTLVIE